jgi:hypothetical protein
MIHLTILSPPRTNNTKYVVEEKQTGPTNHCTLKKLHVSMTILKTKNLQLEEEPLIMKKSAASQSKEAQESKT